MRPAGGATARVSVLFSEPKIPQYIAVVIPKIEIAVSVLFSEPKIPQLNVAQKRIDRSHVSVLFSEPKIPQFAEAGSEIGDVPRFSALQRAENSSI